MTDDDSLAEINAALRQQFLPLERAARALKKAPEYLASVGPAQELEYAREAVSEWYQKQQKHFENRPKEFDSPEYAAFETAEAALRAEIKKAEERREKAEEANKKTHAALLKRALKDFGGNKMIAMAVFGLAVGEPELDKHLAKMGIESPEVGGR